MATVGTVNVKFSANTAEFSKGVDQVKKKTTEAKSFLKDLKDNFGKSSLLGQSLKIAAGSGAIAGLGKAASEILDISEKIKKFAEDSATGKASVADFTTELLKSIPVAGKLGEALANIWSVVSGEAAYVAQIKEATKAQDEHIERVKKFADTLESLRKASQPKTPFDDVNKKIGDAKKQREDDSQKDIISARTRLSALRDQLSKTQQFEVVSAGVGAPGVSTGKETEAWKQLTQDIAAQNEKIKKADSQLHVDLAKIDQAAIPLRGEVFGKIGMEQAKKQTEEYEKMQKKLKDTFIAPGGVGSDEVRKQRIEDAKAAAEANKKAAQDTIEAWKKVVERGQDLQRKGNPATELNETLKELNQQRTLNKFTLGFAGIDETAFDRLAQEAKGKFREAIKVEQPSVDIRRSSFFVGAQQNDLKSINQEAKKTSNNTGAIRDIFKGGVQAVLMSIGAGGN